MDPRHEAPDAATEARRRFLATCGKFAIATPPAITLILSQTGRSYATASSGGRGNNGFGNGGGDPAPGNSGSNGSPNSKQKKDDKVR